MPNEAWWRLDRNRPLYTESSLYCDMDSKRLFFNYPRCDVENYFLVYILLFQIVTGLVRKRAWSYIYIHVMSYGRNKR